MVDPRTSGLLKPCPFCASKEATVTNAPGTYDFWVECPCGAEAHPKPSKASPLAFEAREAAIDVWNTRREPGDANEGTDAFTSLALRARAERFS